MIAKMKGSFRLRSYHPQTLYFAGVVALLFLFALARVFRPMSDWVYSQWLFSYQYGFVKRGLHGEILQWLGFDGSYPVIVMLAILVLIAASMLLLRLFMLLLIGNQNLFRGGKRLLSSPLQLSGWLFFILALFHSATFQTLFFNLGRLEHIQLLLTLGCLFLMYSHKYSNNGAENTRQFQRTGLFLAVSCTIIISLLIHEAFYFFFLPMIFMAWIYTDRGSLRFNMLRISLFAVASLLTWILAVYGVLDLDQYYPYMEAMREQYGVRARYESLIVVFRDTAMNIEYTRGWLFSTPRIPVYVIIFFIIMSPGAILIWKIYSVDLSSSIQTIKSVLFSRGSAATLSDSRCIRAGIFIACFSPLCLIPLGFDIYRWFGVGFLNLFMMTAFLSSDDGFRARILSITHKYWYLAALATGLSFILGGLDAVSNFSNEMYLTDWLELILNR